MNDIAANERNSDVTVMVFASFNGLQTLLGKNNCIFPGWRCKEMMIARSIWLPR